MVKYKFYDKERNLMRTYTDNRDMDLHKTGTDEIYSGNEEEGPVDVIDRIEIVEGQESPRSRFIYEEVKKEPIPEEI